MEKKKITPPAAPAVKPKSRPRRGNRPSHTRMAAPLKNAAPESSRTVLWMELGAGVEEEVTQAVAGR